MDSDSQPKVHKQNSEPDTVKDEIRVVLVGKTGMGKSSLGNSLLKTSKFIADICADAVTENIEVAECESTIFGETIILKVCDTPGMCDSSRSTSEVMKKILECMTQSYPGPHIFLFVMTIGRISNEHIETIELFKDHFGDDVLKYTVIIFTGTDHIDKPLDDWLNQVKNPKFKTFIDNCNKRYESINNKGSEDDKTQDIDRILRLMYKTIMENSGEVYTNAMCRQAKDFYQKKQEEDEKEKETKLRIKIESELRGKIESELRDKLESELRGKIESELRDKIESEIRNKIKEESEAEMTSKQSGLLSEHLQSGDVRTGKAGNKNRKTEDKNDAWKKKEVKKEEKGTRGRVRGPMAEPYKTFFKKKIPKLLNMLKEPDLLLTSLSARSVFDDDDKEKVEKETREKGKKAGMTTLLNTLLDCGQDAFQLFVECLTELNCRPALKLLEFNDKEYGSGDNDIDGKQIRQNILPGDVNTIEEGKKAENKTEEKKEENKKEERKAGNKKEEKKEYRKEEKREENKKEERKEENKKEENTTEEKKQEKKQENKKQEKKTEEKKADEKDSLHKCILNSQNITDSELLLQIQSLIQDGADINSTHRFSFTPLILACKFGLTSVINLLLDHGADVNLVDYKSDTALHYIVKNKHDDIIPCIERIITTGMNINIQNKNYEQTPLMLACEKGRTSVIDFLLDHGADVNLVDYKGNTVLHYVVNIGNDDIIPCIERLINTGININIQNTSNKQTPLMLACTKGLTSVTNLLLDYRAGVNLVDHKGNTVVHYIVDNKHVDNIPCIERLIKTGININIQNTSNKQTPLMLACWHGLTSVINLLLDQGADVNLVDYTGNTILHYIFNIGNDDIIPCIERLINTGININIQNTSNKQTPLMLACKKGLTSVTNLLLDYRADVNLVDYKGNTVLHYVVENKHVDNIPCIERIINTGININTQNKHQHTPLMLACKKGLTSVIDMLLDNGADVNLVDYKGDTALNYLVKLENDDVIPCIEKIIKSGININIQNKYKPTPLMLACEEGLTSVINLLLDHGADVNLVDYKGDTVLHYIVKIENDDIIPCIERIIKTGININIQNKHKQTPLMLACENGLTSVINLLLDYIADVNLVDYKGYTVLHYIVKNKHNDIIPCIERIIKTGININIKNTTGETALDIAYTRGLTSVINLL